MTAPDTPAVELPPVPATKKELLVAALRHANNVGKLLNAVSAEVFKIDDAEGGDQPKYARLHDLLCRRLLEDSGVFLFIAADNLRIDLPDDLAGDDPE